jgi:hypothetical protein
MSDRLEGSLPDHSYFVEPWRILMRKLRYSASLTLFPAIFLFPGASLADDAMIESAVSAAPATLSDQATIVDWDGNVIREGTNGWTCLPDRPDTPGADPWCVNAPWLNFLDAYKNKSEPSVGGLGIAYMLQGDAPVSNSDPYAMEKTNDADWIEGLGAHIMLVLPDKAQLAGFSADPRNGGPWVMWADTPYAHLMIPIVSVPQ